MDAKAATEERSRSKMKRKPDSWKLPKIPVDQIYKKRSFRIFPCSNSSYVVKDFEKTVTLDPACSQGNNNGDMSISLLNRDFMDGFLKKHHAYVHLGLVQVAIKPLTRDRLGAPITVCLRDDRHVSFNNALLAMVETDLSHGPFYFNCFPSYSVYCTDIFDADILLLTLNVKKSGIPLVVTYRLVCKALVNPFYHEMALRSLISDETTYFQGNSRSPKTTVWDEVQVPKEWTMTRR